MSRNHQAPDAPLAPALQVSEWINAGGLDLARLRGKVVVLHAFQMLCPACISHGLPQAERVHRMFRHDDVVVLGLHTVFEHHAVMGAEALRAFVHEYRWSFPIGVDRAVPGQDIPATMQVYGLQGTPSLVVLDRRGRVRLHHFGHIEDLFLGCTLGELLSEDASRDLDGASAESPARPPTAAGCGPAGCALPR